MPPCEIILVVGLAGAGKTSYTEYVERNIGEKNCYLVNLDPAVTKLPYKPDLDIRETVHYDRLIEGGRMGPNGAIILALTMFTTKIDQLVNLLSNLDSSFVVVIDTPGQMEFFSWSNAAEVLVSALNTIQCSLKAHYILDASRMNDRRYFSVNVSHAVNIHETLLPVTIVYNKNDLVNDMVNEINEMIADKENASTEESTMSDMLLEDLLQYQLCTFEKLSSRSVCSVGYDKLTGM